MKFVTSTIVKAVAMYYVVYVRENSPLVRVIASPECVSTKTARTAKPTIRSK